MVLFCHIISQNHVIQGSCGFMDGSHPWEVSTMPSLVAIGILVVEI